MKKRTVAADFDYDYIALDVKRAKAERFRRCCEDFGWEQVGRRADRRYADIVHLRFRRPHAVPAKDALQLLQVRLELAWNAVGRAESALAARTLAALLCLLFFAALSLAAGATLLALLWGTLWARVLGFVLAGLGLLCGAEGLHRLAGVTGGARKKHRDAIAAAREQIDALCAAARGLRAAGEMFPSAPGTLSAAADGAAAGKAAETGEGAAGDESVSAAAQGGAV